MAKFQSPLLGYNNNVRHKNRVFHIQTEDSGVNHPHIITHLFMDGGRILKSVKKSYAEYVGADGMSETVRGMMKDQHKAMFIALRDGQFDHLLDPGAAGPASTSGGASAAATADAKRAASSTTTAKPSVGAPNAAATTAAPTAASSAATTATTAGAASAPSVVVVNAAASNAPSVVVTPAATPSGAASIATAPAATNVSASPSTSAMRAASASAASIASAAASLATAATAASLPATRPEGVAVRVEVSRPAPGNLPEVPAVAMTTAELDAAPPVPSAPRMVAALVVAEDDDDAPATTRQPDPPMPSVPPAATSAGKKDLTLDLDGLDRSVPLSGPSLFQTHDLPPPPKNVFSKEGGTGGAYRTIEPDASRRQDHTQPAASAAKPASQPSQSSQQRPQAGRTPSRPPSESRYAPARPAAIFGTSGTRPPPQSIFSDELISDKSLDEVILSYLAEDLEPPRRK